MANWARVPCLIVDWDDVQGQIRSMLLLVSALVWLSC